MEASNNDTKRYLDHAERMEAARLMAQLKDEITKLAGHLVMICRMSARWNIITGALLLVAALVLYVVHGVLLMGYDDNGYGEWDWGRANVWLASIPTRFRVAFWITATGAPAFLLAGAASIVLGICRAFGRRVAKRVDSTSAEDA